MTLFWIALVFFIIVAVSMILIILVQRPQGGGLSGAFGGAGGGAGAETVFGGRVGDALTYATVAAFVLYLGLAITLNLLDVRPARATNDQAPGVSQPVVDPQGLGRDQLDSPPGADPGAPPAAPPGRTPGSPPGGPGG